MKILIFDVYAPFAFFKIPEGTRSSYSFPFPPKTAIIGLLAGILGEERNKYWKNDSKYRRIKVGVQILEEPERISIKMNYWRSKTTFTIKKYKFILPGDVKSRGFTTQMKIDYLKSANYRLYIGMDNIDEWQDLIERIRSRRYYYPPYLGHANCLAEIEYVDLLDGENISSGEFSTVIPRKAIPQNVWSKYVEIGGFNVIYSIPTSYTTEKIEVDNYTRWSHSPSGSDSFFLPIKYQKLKFELKDGYGYSIETRDKSHHICLF